jgi:hypothetical protein
LYCFPIYVKDTPSAHHGAQPGSSLGHVKSELFFFLSENKNKHIDLMYNDYQIKIEKERIIIQ